MRLKYLSEQVIYQNDFRLGISISWKSVSWRCASVWVRRRRVLPDADSRAPEFTRAERFDRVFLPARDC